MQKIAAIILAAGYSRRMHAIKPLIEIDGTIMLDYAANIFIQSDIGKIIVITGYEAERVSALARARGYTTVYNPHFATGMFSSILAGIAAVPSDFHAAFILPVDIPFVSPTTVRALAQAICDQRAAIPHYKNEPGHPPLIHRSWFEALSKWHGNDGLSGFFHTHASDIACIDVDDPGIMRDIDTPKDLERIIRQRFDSRNAYT
jgi:CTP:molybdopterin cytidylyltransferase MocA